MNKSLHLLIARAELYRLLSTGFLYPNQKLLTSLRNGSFIQGLMDAVRHLPRSYGLTSEVAVIHKAIHEARQPIADSEFEAEYSRVFTHGNPIVAPPYETEYGTEHIFAKTKELADIAGFYRAFGLTPSDQLKERVDHIGTELEFMYVLLTKEAYAAFNNWAERADTCRDAERNFLVDHLTRWAPSLCRLLRETANLPYYRALAGMVARFVLAECEMMNVKIELREDLLPKLSHHVDFVCPMTECVVKDCPVGP